MNDFADSGEDRATNFSGAPPSMPGAPIAGLATGSTKEFKLNSSVTLGTAMCGAAITVSGTTTSSSGSTTPDGYCAARPVADCLVACAFVSAFPESFGAAVGLGSAGAEGSGLLDAVGIGVALGAEDTGAGFDASCEFEGEGDGDGFAELEALADPEGDGEGLGAGGVGAEGICTETMRNTSKLLSAAAVAHAKYLPEFAKSTGTVSSVAPEIGTHTASLSAVFLKVSTSALPPVGQL